MERGGVGSYECAIGMGHVTVVVVVAGPCARGQIPVGSQDWGWICFVCNVSRLRIAWAKMAYEAKQFQCDAH